MKSTCENKPHTTNRNAQTTNNGPQTINHTTQNTEHNTLDLKRETHAEDLMERRGDGQFESKSSWAIDYKEKINIADEVTSLERVDFCNLALEFWTPPFDCFGRESGNWNLHPRLPTQNCTDPRVSCLSRCFSLCFLSLVLSLSLSHTDTLLAASLFFCCLSLFTFSLSLSLFLSLTQTHSRVWTLGRRMVQRGTRRRRRRRRRR